VTSVSFETATLQAVLNKANRIAPNRGRAFDVAAGIVFEVNVEAKTVIVKSTNLDGFYMEWIDTVEITGESVSWRLPSVALASWVGKLPIGSGKTVKFADLGNGMQATSGRAKWSTSLIPIEFYPEWESFNGEDLTMVTALGARLEQVAWAVDTGNVIPLTGINIDGERLWATNGYRLASVPCEFPLVEEGSVTVPAGILAPIIKQMGDTKVGMVGNFMLFMPDDYTQIKCIIYGEPYQNLSRVKNMQYANVAMFPKTPLIEAINRMTSVSNDRQKELQFTIGSNEIVLYMDQREGVEAVEDAIDLPPGMADHPAHTIVFAPDNLINAIQGGPNEMVTIHYDTGNPLKMLHVDGGSGYLAWTQPKVLTKNVSAGE
jgi:DNA polymerase III sliding clamp (beta) subunit (PCNA family)